MTQFQSPCMICCFLRELSHLPNHYKFWTIPYSGSCGNSNPNQVSTPSLLHCLQLLELQYFHTHQPLLCFLHLEALPSILYQGSSSWSGIHYCKDSTPSCLLFLLWFWPWSIFLLEIIFFLYVFLLLDFQHFFLLD